MIVKKSLKRLADMAEEESLGGVMRIGVRLGELVMGPVVSAPLVDVILQRENVPGGQHHTNAKGRFVRLWR